MTNNFKKTVQLICILMLSVNAIGCTTSYTQESTGQYLDSSVITTKVKAKLLTDNSVKSLPITVKTYKNIVQLSGFVNNAYQKQRAIEITKSVEGVESIDDALVIKKQ